MTRTIIKPKLFSNEPKQKPKPEIEIITSILPSNLQPFKQKLLSGKGFLVYK